MTANARHFAAFSGILLLPLYRHGSPAHTFSWHPTPSRHNWSLALWWKGVSSFGQRSSAALHPLGRMGEISDIVDAILYLEGAGFVTGEILHVDGSQSAGH
jgi:NAD(P)-dependent dehydrogenase (short-subunit alcohol dehydrogenase family)